MLIDTHIGLPTPNPVQQHPNVITFNKKRPVLWWRHHSTAMSYIVVAYDNSMVSLSQQQIPNTLMHPSSIYTQQHILIIITHNRQTAGYCISTGCQSVACTDRWSDPYRCAMHGTDTTQTHCACQSAHLPIYIYRCMNANDPLGVNHVFALRVMPLRRYTLLMTPHVRCTRWFLYWYTV